MTTSLLRNQVKLDLQTKYLGSIAGVWWAVVNPLVQVGIYVLLLGVVLGVRPGGASSAGGYAVFLLAGMIPWLAMSEGLTASSQSVVKHGAIVKNVVFPLELLPVSAVLVSLVSLGVAFAALLGFLGASGDFPGLALLALPLLVAVQVLLTIGAGLLLAVVGTFLRDLNQVLPVLLQAFMLATPIVYPVESAPSWLAAASAWNPVHHLVAGYRAILLDGAMPALGGLAYAASVGALAALAGWWAFRKAKGHFEAVV